MRPPRPPDGGHAASYPARVTGSRRGGYGRMGSAFFPNPGRPGRPPAPGPV